MNNVRICPYCRGYLKKIKIMNTVEEFECLDCDKSIQFPRESDIPTEK